MLFRACISMAVFILCTAGCGYHSDLPPLAKVTGIVTLDGHPLTTGNVQFMPDGSKGTSGRMSVGGIDQEGRFEMTTLKPGDGSQIGHHLVAIQAYEILGSQDPNSPTPIVSKPLIPERYGDPHTSGLTAEVHPDRENHLTFELISHP